MSIRNETTYNGDLRYGFQQLDLLQEYNELYWDNFFPEETFRHVQIPRRMQRLGAAVVLHADFGNPGETVRRWRDIYFGDMWEMAHFNMLSLGHTPEQADNFLRLHPNTITYEPGIHPVVLDLTFPGHSERSTITELREEAAGLGLKLAHGEVLSALGLNSGLRLRRTDRFDFTTEHTPYLPGYEYNDPYEVRMLGRTAWNWVVRTDTGREGVGLRAFQAHMPRLGVVPVVRELASAA